MSWIETESVDDLARSLFDASIVPLGESRRASGKAGYFAIAPDPAAPSYFTSIDPASAGPNAVDLPGGGRADGLIDALAAFWNGHGDMDLAAAAPALQTLAVAIRAERAQQSADVDIYCYTMF